MSMSLYFTPSKNWGELRCVGVAEFTAATVRTQHLQNKGCKWTHPAKLTSWGLPALLEAALKHYMCDLVFTWFVSVHAYWKGKITFSSADKTNVCENRWQLVKGVTFSSVVWKVKLSDLIPRAQGPGQWLKKYYWWFDRKLHFDQF